MTASPGEVLPIAVRGRGCYIEDVDGRRYLDACGGAMVMLLGHCHSRLLAALGRQAEQLTFSYRFTFRNDPMLDLAERIARIAPGDLEWSFFNMSGSEANESAMHLAVLYWQGLGKPAKTGFLSRASSFHGSTLGALSLSGRYRAPFAPLLHDYAAVPNLPSAEAAAAALEAEILARGPENLAAYVVEPLTGSSGAAIELPPGYLRAARKLCDRYELLLVADEVITAFGRTGCWFAVEHLDAVPDVITFGKGVGGGVLPLSGLVASARLQDVINRSPAGFSYGHTFSGYPLGCAVGCAVLDTIADEGLVEAAAVRGALLRGRLEELHARHPIVRSLRGRGLVQGIELRDPVTGADFAPADAVSARVAAAAKEAGLMIYPAPAALPDRYADALLLAPPLVIGEAEIDELTEKLDAALGAVEREVARR
jgi:adenosylmethionine-8-amino-7-oxononanoate aminotransferase